MPTIAHLKDAKAALECHKTRLTLINEAALNSLEEGLEDNPEPGSSGTDAAVVAVLSYAQTH